MGKMSRRQMDDFFRYLPLLLATYNLPNAVMLITTVLFSTDKKKIIGVLVSSNQFEGGKVLHLLSSVEFCSFRFKFSVEILE